MAGMLTLRRMLFGLAAFCMATCCWMRLTAREKRALARSPFGERGVISSRRRWRGRPASAARRRSSSIRDGGRCCIAERPAGAWER